jgi:hypothetical protein
MKPAKSASVHTREATVKSAHPAAVETSASAPAMSGIGGIWLAERGSE